MNVLPNGFCPHGSTEICDDCLEDMENDVADWPTMTYYERRRQRLEPMYPYAVLGLRAIGLIILGAVVTALWNYQP